MKKKFLAMAIFLLVAGAGAVAGRSAFSSVATIEKVDKVDGGWWRPDTWDVYLRGADGKFFMLHFHGYNQLAASTVGQRVRIDYVQERDSCQTGFTDEVISLAIVQ